VACCGAQSPENTVTYIVALAQFIILALVFNKGMPHRSPMWTNLWLVLALLIQVRSTARHCAARC
jgi:cation-transporting ATPase 13A3/4/5